jgi:uncharacterized protein (TIGR02391 family)
MINLTTVEVASLPVDQLGLVILKDLIATKAWNEHNYLLEAKTNYSGDALQAFGEAYQWLRSRAFVARDPEKMGDNSIFVTRTGKKVADEGPETFHVLERLQVGLHPRIDKEVRTQFLIGKPDLGVFAAMKAIEIRVREIGQFPNDVVGVELMTKAFKPDGGSLADTKMPMAEREGLMALFRGTYAVLRNPAGHRDVDYDDITEAAEAAGTASMLMRILDRIEARIK